MKLFVFGMGYSAEAFAKRQLVNGHSVTATVRSHEKALKVTEAGLTARAGKVDGLG